MYQKSIPIILPDLRMTFAAAAKRGGGKGGAGLMKAKNSKPEEVRKSNIQATKALAEAVRTSLGPRYFIEKSFTHIA